MRKLSGFSLILACFLSFCLVLASCPEPSGNNGGNSNNSGTQATEGLSFTLLPDGNAYSVSRGWAAADEVIIPASYGGKPVTQIEENGFYNYQGSLVTITIPNSVTSIGFGTFRDCSSLTSITIHDGVTDIDYNTFYGCSSLTSVTIPDGVKSIGNFAFSNCSSLTSITIPDSVTSISSNAFSNCSSLTSITIPDGVTNIDTEVFYGCSSLTSVTINNVTIIGDSAFKGCSSLTSITIPDSVTSIGREAFSNCSSLTSVTFAPGSAIITDFNFDSAFPGNGFTLRSAYLAGGAGTYTRANDGNTWTKQYPYPVVTDFKIIGTGTFAYDGNSKTVTVTANPGTNIGAITVKYNGSTTAPTAVGTYAVTFDVASVAGYWSAVNDMSAGTLTITPSGITFTVDSIAAQTYTGSAKTPVVTVRDGTTALTLTTDYTVSYTNNTNAGTATVTVTGAGNYAGSTGSQTFTINPKVMTFTVDSIVAQTYNGSAKTPAVTVRDGSTALTLTTDYTVSYTNNTNAGTATATIAGAGNYAGSTGSKTFTITPKVMIFTVDSIAAQTYTGSAKTPVVTVRDGPTALTLTTDYTVSYTNNTYAGTATATITGAGNYAGSTGSQTFTINKANGATVSAPTEASKTMTSITLNAVTASTGQTVEYSRSNAGSNTSNGIWQDSPTFNELTNGTTYYFFARAKEDDNHNIGATSSGRAIVAVNQYTVTFDANGATSGTAPPDTRTTNAASSIALPGQGTLVRTGYSFGGWNTEADGTGTNYSAFLTYNLDSNITLYVRWISLSPEMVYVPGGSFQMGSNDADDREARPPHMVTLTGFYMSKYEVTQAQYQLVMGTNPSYFNFEDDGGSKPVEMLSWYSALVYCNKLSIKEGLTPAYSINGSTDPASWGSVPINSDSTWNAVVVVSGSTGYRLPTEAQWEYAAKGGNGSPGNYTYAGSNNIGEVAWYSYNSVHYRTSNVGTKTPNRLGLYDMSGNVSEWCWDWFGTYPSTAQTDPVGASSGGTGNLRVIRGGDWSDAPEHLRSAYRSGGQPQYNDYPDIGFRIVRP